MRSNEKKGRNLQTYDRYVNELKLFLNLGCGMTHGYCPSSDFAALALILRLPSRTAKFWRLSGTTILPLRSQLL
jgi:hypothetical protein